MTTFISYGMNGRLSASRTIDEAKAGAAFTSANIIVQTDDQFTPRPLTAAWVLVAHANSSPYWVSADPVQTAIRIAQTSLGQPWPTPPTPILTAEGVASGFKYPSQAAALRALADAIPDNAVVEVTIPR